LELILTRLGTTGRRSRLVHDTRLNLRRLLLDRVKDQRRQGQPVSDQQWQELQNLSQKIIAEDPWVFGRVYGHLALAEIHTARRQHEPALAAAQELIRVYQQGDRENWQALKAQLAWAHLYAGRALQNMGRWDEALTHYRWVTDVAYDYPPYGSGSETRSDAYFLIWMTLRQARAPQQEVAQAAQALLSRFPDSEVARRVDGTTEQ